jgi:chromosome segregation ATPase
MTIASQLRDIRDQIDVVLTRLDMLHNKVNDLSNQFDTLSESETAILTKENAMAIDLAGITAEVERNTTETESVKQLVTNLAAIIAGIPPSTDPVTQAALDQLKTTLKTNDDAIADLVVANTPAAP